MRSNDSVSKSRAVPGPVAASRGFSLVEIMIVVVIIGLMAGLVTYAATGVSRPREEAARAIRHRDVQPARSTVTT